MVNVNVNQETVKRSYTITLMNLTFNFVKVVQNANGQERKKNALISCRKIYHSIRYMLLNEGRRNFSERL